MSTSYTAPPDRMVLNGPFPPALLSDVRDLGPEEACFMGILQLLGVRHYVYFIEVHDVPDPTHPEHGAEQMPVNDPHNRLEAVDHVDGHLATVGLPGCPGREFLVVVEPSGR